MSEVENETPGLCKDCQQWLCAGKDAFCACCGAGLVAALFSTDRLALDDQNPSALTISNQGLFRLYWAAEVVAPEPGVRALFSVAPDYGVIVPGAEQLITVKLQSQSAQDRTGIRAHLEIASNDPRRPEVKVAIMAGRET